jgi:hypothetical protein
VDRDSRDNEAAAAAVRFWEARCVARPEAKPFPQEDPTQQMPVKKKTACQNTVAPLTFYFWQFLHIDLPVKKVLFQWLGQTCSKVSNEVVANGSVL